MLAPADEDTAAAAVRGRGRPGGAGAVQRLGRPAARSARSPPPGCGAGCADGEFDVLHVHEPVTPSLSLLAVLSARGPIVATFHTAMTRVPGAVRGAGHAAAGRWSRSRARIAVSELARQVQVEHLGGGRGGDPERRGGGALRRRRAAARLAAGRAARSASSAASTSRARASPVLLRRVRPRWRRTGPGCGCWSPAGATRTRLRGDLPAALAGRVDLPRPGQRGGQGPDAAQRRRLRARPNTGGESFGIILTEAMAAGTPVAASDLDAFRRVLDDGRAGVLFPTGDAAALAGALAGLLDDPDRRAALAGTGAEVVAAVRLAGGRPAGAGGVRDGDRRRPGPGHPGQRDSQ